MEIVVPQQELSVSTQKFKNKLYHFNRHELAVANAENFHAEGSLSGIWWSFVLGVRCL